MARQKSQSLRDQALRIFKSNGGLLRTSEALEAGIHPRIFYELRDGGTIERLSPGLYGLVDLPDLSYPDLAAIAKQVPKGVICLTAALYFHRLTVQIPRWVDVAIPSKYHPPKIEYPPAQFHWFGDRVFSAGVEVHDLGGIAVRVYGKEKCIVDCFRLRHKVGIDVAIEALKNYWEQGHIHMDQLEKLAEESRVFRLMTPYLRTVMHDQS